jgi:hypothetical protein
VQLLKKNTASLLDADKEAGLDINTKKTKCMFMSLHQTTDGTVLDQQASDLTILCQPTGVFAMG